METSWIFTDGSVDVKSKVGFGAYLLTQEGQVVDDQLKDNIKLKRFEQTSSTKLELQTLVWALNAIPNRDGKIVIFTDSQNIIGLPGRREKMESNNYHTKTGKLLNNHEVYQKLFSLLDQYDYRLQKVKGHQKTNKKNNYERLFALVDRASRKSLREGFL